MRYHREWLQDSYKTKFISIWYWSIQISLHIAIFIIITNFLRALALILLYFDDNINSGCDWYDGLWGPCLWPHNWCSTSQVLIGFSMELTQLARVRPCSLGWNLCTQCPRVRSYSPGWDFAHRAWTHAQHARGKTLLAKLGPYTTV